MNDAQMLRAFVAYRRAEIEAEEASRPPGLGHIRQNNPEHVLTELERMADWVEKGGLEFKAPLTKAERDHWRWAREHNIEVPEDIAKQL